MHIHPLAQSHDPLPRFSMVPVIFILDPTDAVAPLLDDQRYALFTLHERAQCFALLEQHHPDLIIIHEAAADPFDLCRELADAYPQVALLLQTEAVERALAAGADDIIAPDAPATLMQRRVQHVLASVQIGQQRHVVEQIVEQDNVIKLVIKPGTGQIIDANMFACVFYGYPYAAITRRTIADLDAQPERQMMQQVFQATENHSTYFVFEHQLASGSVREVEMYASPLRLNNERLLYILGHDVSSRRQMETALRESESRYRTLVESTSDVIFVVSTDARLTYISPAFEKITGWPVRDWVGHSLIPWIHHDDLAYALDVFERTVSGERLRMLELRFNTATGETGIGEFVFQPQLQSGRIIGVWGTMRDITARRQAEWTAHEQRAFAEALRDTAAVLNSTLDQHELFSGILTQLNRVLPSDSANITLIEDGLTRIVSSRGYDARDTSRDMLTLRYTVDETANLRRMVETRQPLAIPDVYAYPGWVLSPAIAWIRSHVGAPIIIDGEVIGFIILDSADVGTFGQMHADRLQSFANQAAIAIRNARLYSALRQQAAELEQRVAERTRELDRERAQLQAILEAMSEGVVYDEGLAIRYTNGAMARLVGYAADHWRDYASLFVTDDASDDDSVSVVDTMHATVSRGQPWVRELRMRRQDGTLFDAHITATPVIDTGGAAVGAVTVVRDISHEKALHEQKARFVAHASHELRTPLTNMKTRLYLLRRQPEQLDRHLAVLEAVTNRMRNLIEDLLDVSRFERGIIELHRRSVILQDLLDEIVTMQQPEAERQQIRLLTDLPPDPIHIDIDSERITQVLTNLVTNALNYTDENGTVTVRLSCVPASERRAASACIAVADTGIGIAPEHLEAIFAPFFRASAGDVSGTGLGLSISKEIVDLHGGDITVESTPGVGSTFCVWLPLSPAAEPSSK